MSIEHGPTNEVRDANPILELVAQHMEAMAISMFTRPGDFDEREGAVPDITDAASYAMHLADEIRNGNVERALGYLRMRARFDEEAYILLKTLDPNTEPFYPDADANGIPVVVGKKYRWTPDERFPDYFKEGVVIKVVDKRAFAAWEAFGEVPSVFRSPEHEWDEAEQDEYVENVLVEIEKDVIPQETWTFARMLTPVE